MSSAIAKSKIDFFESLRDFFKADTLDVDNKQRCQICKALNNSQIRFRLKTRKLTFKLINCSTKNLDSSHEKV
jgi:hypothetical protein